HAFGHKDAGGASFLLCCGSGGSVGSRGYSGAGTLG
ncbi:hypothetical protein AHiyo6_29250, partial [Arthrobacter sp. Hiyo6]